MEKQGTGISELEGAIKNQISRIPEGFDIQDQGFHAASELLFGGQGLDSRLSLIQIYLAKVNQFHEQLESLMALRSGF